MLLEAGTIIQSFRRRATEFHSPITSRREIANIDSAVGRYWRLVVVRLPDRQLDSYSCACRLARDAQSFARDHRMADQICCYLCQLPSQAQIRVCDSRRQFMSASADNRLCSACSYTATLAVVKPYLLLQWPKSAASTSLA